MTEITKTNKTESGLRLSVARNIAASAPEWLIISDKQLLFYESW